LLEIKALILYKNVETKVVYLTKYKIYVYVVANSDKASRRYSNKLTL